MKIVDLQSSPDVGYIVSERKQIAMQQSRSEMGTGMESKQTIWTFRRRLVLLLGSGVIVFLVYLAVRYLFVLASPFIIAYGIALVIEKPVNALAKVFRGKKALASTLIVTGLTIIIAAAVFILHGWVWQKLRVLLLILNIYLLWYG